MKHVGKLGIVLLLLALGYSCQKERSLENGSHNPGSNKWEFNEGGVLFKGNMDSAEYANAGSLRTLLLHGTSTDGSGGLVLTITDVAITSGTTYKSPQLFFQYTIDGSPFYEIDVNNPDNFSLTITSIDGTTVSGIFSGDVVDISGNVKTITDGRFTATFKNVAPPPPPPVGDGQLTVWAKQACSGETDVLVTVKDQTGHITTFSATAPACGAAGSAAFTLPAGDYTWSAQCGLEVAEGAVTVTVGNCTTAEVVFPSSGATCRVSNIASYELSSGAPLGAITSFFNTANLVNKIQVFDSSTFTLLNTFDVSYAGIQINVDAQQYFLLEPGFRISEFHGFIDPADNTTPEVVLTYQYDASGFMSQAQLALKSAPTVPILTETFTWTGNNLTKIVLQPAGTAERSEIDYQYDLTKEVRGFLAFFPNSEILTFQTAINFGRNSTNVVTQSTTTDYDLTGTAQTPKIGVFTNYVIDSNGYVRSFEVTGSQSVYGVGLRYVLSYKCL